MPVLSGAGVAKECVSPIGRGRTYGVSACHLFLLPEGRRSRQRDEGARVAIDCALAPSSDPSGHLLPCWEKKGPATPVRAVSRRKPHGKQGSGNVCRICFRLCGKGRGRYCPAHEDSCH